jgi:hypothetical protein|uniref:Protease n=1 Tax=Myoviridae sp. ctsip2 TaxID=2826705 RepID=A0A8S5N573_9CAUD|nr:MAG TPA: protease [Myoviridae sp. ctsip2]
MFLHNKKNFFNVVLFLLIFFAFAVCANAVEGSFRPALGLNFMKYKDCLFVFYIQKDTPAYNEILPGDEIIEVNNTSVAKLTRTQCLPLFAGKEGTIVKLKIRRSGEILEKQLIKKRVFMSDSIEITPGFSVKTEHAIVNGYPHLWITMFNQPPFEQGFYKKKAVYARKLWAFDCYRQIMAQTEHIEYYKNNTYYQAPSITSIKDYEWHRIIPDTVSYEAYKYACIFFKEF